MTRSQRRAHLVVWLVLGPALVAVVSIAAVLARGGPARVEPIESGAVHP